MKVLVIGSGGREHALCWKLRQSPNVKMLYCAPGNAGTANIAKNIDIKIGQENYLIHLSNLVKDEGIDLTVVGPELPLANGIVDHFNRCGLKIFGPKRGAAKLEASKVFAKEFMDRHCIPTARYKVFNEYKEARDYLNGITLPVVIKVDGLAFGKGSFVCGDLDEADSALKGILLKRCFGEAGGKVIIEEYLEGEEVSFLAFSDGKSFLSMASSCDHKRLYDDDEGPNTGGMGAYSPTPLITYELQRRIEKEILDPTIKGLLSEDEEFVGVIYLGLMITKQGPKVLEYNVRFGDPEAQVILPRLKSDLVLVFEACINGELDRISLEWDDRSTVCVILASSGYPGDYKKGKEIVGLDEVKKMEDVIVFHSGTIDLDGRVLTNGGRVLSIVAFGKGIKEAKDLVYQAIERISFEGMQFRRDIGKRAILG